MLMLGAVTGLSLLWLVLHLRRPMRPRGLLHLESQQSVEMARVWLRLAAGYKLVHADDAHGLFIWERGRRFHDGGLFYYAEIWQDARTRRARLVAGVVGHTFHTDEELASARSRFVSGQLFHLTDRSAEDALVRAADVRTVRIVHPSVRGVVGQQANRPPAIDLPMSPSAARFVLRAPLNVVADAIGDLSRSGWRLVETASLDRGFVNHRRYCFEDAAARRDAGAEYLLEVCGYADDDVHLAIDWFPIPDAGRTPRRPAELEADIRRRVERTLVALEPAE